MSKVKTCGNCGHGSTWPKGACDKCKDVNSEWTPEITQQAARALLDGMEEADGIICLLCKRLNPQHENCVSCRDRDVRVQDIANAKGESDE